MLKISNKVLLQEDVYILPDSDNRDSLYNLILFMEMVLENLPSETRLHTKVTFSKQVFNPCTICEDCAFHRFGKCKNHAVCQPVAVFRHVSSNLLSFLFELNQFLAEHKMFTSRRSEICKLTLRVKQS